MLQYGPAEKHRKNEGLQGEGKTFLLNSPRNGGNRTYYGRPDKGVGLRELGGES